MKDCFSSTEVESDQRPCSQPKPTNCLEIVATHKVHPLTLKWLPECKLAGCPVLKSKSKIGKGGMGGRWAYSRACQTMPSRGHGSLPACSRAQAPVSHSTQADFTVLRCTCHPQVCSDQVPQIPGSQARQTGTPGSGHIPPTSTPT